MAKVKNKKVIKNQMINLTNVKGALVSTLLMAVLAGLVYVLNVGDVFALDVKSLVNVVTLSLATGFISLIKSLLTSDEGIFLGAVKVK